MLCPFKLMRYPRVNLENDSEKKWWHTICQCEEGECAFWVTFGEEDEPDGMCAIAGIAISVSGNPLDLH